MSTLSQSVQDAIAKDLPGLAAGELKTFIENAQKVEAELERTKAQLVDRQRDNASLKEELSKHRALSELQASLDAEASRLQDRDLTLLKREAILEGKLAQAELNGVRETMSAFLRNPTIRTTVVSDATKPIEGTPPGVGQSYGLPGRLERNGDGRPDTTTTTVEQQ